MNAQIIERNGKPEWAVIPFKNYLEMLEQLEMLQDIRDYDEIKAGIANGTIELIPSEVVYAILDGQNPIQVWREFRGLSQHDLAEKAGISVPYLSQLEHGKRRGTLEVLSAIGKALGVGLDELHLR